MTRQAVGNIQTMTGVPAPTLYHRWLGWHAPAMRRDITGPRQQHGSTTGAGFSECFGTVLDPSSRVLMFVSIFLIKVPA